MSRSLTDLSSDARPLIDAALKAIGDRGVRLAIVDVLRTPKEHAKNLKRGTSGTTFSLHLPRNLRPSTLVGYKGSPEDNDRSDAIDVAPMIRSPKGNGKWGITWDPGHPHWGIIIEEFERVGLRSGARWRKPVDLGHAEFVLPVKEAYLAEERTRPLPTFRTV